MIIRETTEMSDTERMTARNSNMEYIFNEFWNKIYPVDSIYISTSSTSPATLFGGTWEQIKDTFLLAAGETYTAGETGGEAVHTLTVAEMAKHKHNPTGGTMIYDTEKGNSLLSVGSDMASAGYLWNQGVESLASEEAGEGQPHNNMPPYLAVYVWKRVS